MVQSRSLGAAVRQRRRELGLTQEQLAERASEQDDVVRQSDISRLECGRVSLPRRARVERLARALDLSPGELLARSGWAGNEPAPDRPAGDGWLAEPPRGRSRACLSDGDRACVVALEAALVAARDCARRLERLPRRDIEADGLAADLDTLECRLARLIELLEPRVADASAGARC